VDGCGGMGAGFWGWEMDGFERSLVPAQGTEPAGLGHMTSL
jgi:hypothetical protein